MLPVIALLVGEALLLAGLSFTFWPLALVAAGAQLVTASLIHEKPKAKGRT